MNNYNEFPQIIGHRGASAYAPENTMPAFKLALEQGADGFELDTMLTADGIPIVIHDRSVDRTTNGTGNVEKITLAEIQALDAGGWFSRDFAGTNIPLLEEVLDTFKGQEMINIELKNSHSPNNTLPDKVVELVEKVNGFDHILFSSFNYSGLQRIKKLHPEAKIGLLFPPGIFPKLLALNTARSIKPECIHPHFSSCSMNFIQRQHDQSREVNAWTVNNKKLIEDLWARGIDGIITNDPQIAVQVKTLNS